MDDEIEHAAEHGAPPVGNRVRIAFLALLAFLAAASCYKAPDFAYSDGNLWLQHFGTLAVALPLLADLKFRKFSLAVCICLVLFGALHVLGARYLYSYVPYDEWAEKLFKWHIDTEEGLHGNKFDRLVHFCFGLLLLPLFFQIAERWLKVGNFAVSLLVAWLFVQFGSMLYEIFEWGLSVVLSPESAEDYNGQQGDIWDAQKDMFLALIGSTVTAAYLACRHWFVGRMKRGKQSA